MTMMMWMIMIVTLYENRKDIYDDRNYDFDNANDNRIL